jgi:hypothetical protein
MCGMHKPCSQLNHLLNHEDDDVEDDEEEELDEDDEDEEEELDEDDEDEEEELDEDDEVDEIFMTFRMKSSFAASALPGLFRFFLDFSSPFSSERVSTSGDETSS